LKNSEEGKGQLESIHYPNFMRIILHIVVEEDYTNKAIYTVH